MTWPFSFYRLLYPADRYVWVQVCILHETHKAILVYNGARFWIPKSQIRAIRLRRNSFEICVRRSLIA